MTLSLAWYDKDVAAGRNATVRERACGRLVAVYARSSTLASLPVTKL
ncbi:MAG: hypothetical protein AB7V11_08665 [Pyrinomonadaceae bacterium]